MRSKPQEPAPIQPNMEPAPEEEAVYSLEEILNEFGGWTDRAKPQPPAEEAVSEPADAKEPPSQEEDTPEEASAEVPAEKLAEKASAPAEPEEVSQTEEAEISAQETPEPVKIWTFHPDTEPEEKAPAKKEKKKPAREKRPKKQKLPREPRVKQPEHTFSSAQEAYQFYRQQPISMLRLLLSILCLLFSAAIALLGSSRLFGLSLATDETLCGILCVSFLLLQVLLSYDILLTGLSHLLRFQFDQWSLLVISLLVCFADSFFQIEAGQQPLCCVLSLELIIALWSRHLELIGKRTTYKAASASENPVGAICQKNAWHGHSCVFRQEGRPDEFLSAAEQPDACSLVMRIYAPAYLLLCLAVCIYFTWKTGADFLHLLCALLILGCPVGIFPAFVRPFLKQAKVLSKQGGSLSGWKGVNTLGKGCSIVAADSDLFPQDCVSLNGMKLFSSQNQALLIGYANAIISASGSGLLPLFESLMEEQNGYRVYPDSFRHYEGGGFGAEFGGDVVLMGSIGFMRLMKVQIPEGTRLRQAVYLSVNAELAAVFALQYAPDAEVQNALLASDMPGTAPLILATRDFMLTPQFLRHRYRVSAEHMEYPNTDDRISLSASSASREGEQAALLSADDFPLLSSAVQAARSIRRETISSVAISLLGSLLGFALIIFLSVLQAQASINPANLLIYIILWCLPGFLIASFPH